MYSNVYHTVPILFCVAGRGLAFSNNPHRVKIEANTKDKNTIFTFKIILAPWRARYLLRCSDFLFLIFLAHQRRIKLFGDQYGQASYGLPHAD
jgi:hypothetical protein